MRLIRFFFSAGKEWERIATVGNIGFFFVLCVSLLPLLALSCAGEAFGLMRLGEAKSDLGQITLPPEQIIRYVAFYAVATLAAILLGGVMIKAVGESFNVTAPYSAYFALLAYSFSPIILMHLPDGLPAINTWVCFAVGLLLGWRILYHGVAFALKPEQTKGFGMLLMNLIYVSVTSALVHFASIEVLHGRLLKKL